MSEPEKQNWGLVGSIRHGVKELFPTRRTKSAMWGLVGLGVLITYMELMAARFFSSLITNTPGIKRGLNTSIIVCSGICTPTSYSSFCH